MKISAAYYRRTRKRGWLPSTVWRRAIDHVGGSYSPENIQNTNTYNITLSTGYTMYLHLTALVSVKNTCNQVAAKLK